MTENESKEILEDIWNFSISVNGNNEYLLRIAIDTAIQALSEIQQYRAIGTVEELEEAKIQFDNINSAANSVALMGLCDFETAKESVIATVKAMKDEAKCDGCAGCTMWKCDCANERAYAIDEFAERLKSESYNGYATLEDYCEDTIECVAMEDIDRIAEQLKAGVKNV